MGIFANPTNLSLILRKRARMITAIPQSITTEVVNDYLRWRKCNGKVYAVARMKVIKQIMINTYAGHPEIPEDLWIAKCKFNRDALKGHYGTLQKMVMKNARMCAEVVKLLNLYTVEVEIELTQESILKFRQAVETPGTPVSQKYLDVIERAVLSTELSYIPSYLLKEVQYASKFILAGPMKKHHEEDLLLQVESFFRTDIGRNLIINYDCVSRPLIDVLGFRGYRFMDNKPFMGRIHCIPSPGLKDRWVCDFKKPLEWCVKPLGKRLYDIVRNLPWDITFDEAKCFEPIQEKLRMGCEVSSVDLSNATDRFPWSLQLKMLKSFDFGPKFQEMVELFNLLVRLPAEMPDGTSIRWEQGQPLGAYPSFAVFTLCHGLLLYGLNDCKFNNDFFIHGDDVVITNSELAEKYYLFLDEEDIDRSVFKTITSARLAMINSKLITPDRVSSVPKWKPFDKSNAMSMIEHWGLDVLKFLKYDEEEITLISYFAALPKEYGGVGVNPRGYSLEERVNRTWDKIFQDDKGKCFAPSARRRVMDRFHDKPNFFNLLGGALRVADKADQADAQQYLDNYRKYPHTRDLLSSMSSTQLLDTLGLNQYEIAPDLSRPLGSPTSYREKDPSAPEQVKHIVDWAIKSHAFSEEKEKQLRESRGLPR